MDGLRIGGRKADARGLHGHGFRPTQALSRKRAGPRIFSNTRGGGYGAWRPRRTDRPPIYPRSRSSEANAPDHLGNSKKALGSLGLLPRFWPLRLALHRAIS